MSISPVEMADLEFDLADRMRKSLRVSGISSAEMADILEVSRNTVSGWLNGAREPKRLYLRIWAVRTGVPLKWLETGEAPSPEGNGASDGAPYQNRTGDLFITSRTVRGAEQVVSIDRGRREAEPLAA